MALPFVASILAMVVVLRSRQEQNHTALWSLFGMPETL